MILNKYFDDLEKTIYFKSICDNSKLVKKGDLFIAIKGKNYDGKSFIAEAIKNGACFIISETDILDFPSIKVVNAKETLISLLNFYYPNHQKLHLIGVTGTDGKTTTSTILYDLLSKISTASYIGTNGIMFNKSHFKTKNTTPSNTTLYKTLDSLYYRKIEYSVIEMSSEGILDNRGTSLSFDACIFTNISHEHLNTHKTMKNYINTKLRLFKQLKKDGIAIINYDIDYKDYILKHISNNIITFGLKGGDYLAKNIITTLDGTLFDLYYKNHFLTQIETSFVGEFNVYNVLSSIAYLYETGISMNIIRNSLNDKIKVDGRFDYFKYDRKNFIVDFGHTPRGIKETLKTIKKFNFNHIICIVGSQGGKDYTKRKYIGDIASRLSDILILTSEDPKNENIFNIFFDLRKKIKKDYYITLNRFEAIKLGISLMIPNDLLIIFGKGNEETEQFKSYFFKYNDKDTIIKLLNS